MLACKEKYVEKVRKSLVKILGPKRARSEANLVAALAFAKHEDASCGVDYWVMTRFGSKTAKKLWDAVDPLAEDVVSFLLRA